MITTAIQPTQTPQPVRFTVQDYHRLVDLGFLGEDDHIELIRGELIQMAARGTTHDACITRLLRVLLPSIGEKATLQCQSPITIASDGEPEPDFAIVQNREDDYVIDRTLEAYSEPAQITPGQFDYLNRQMVTPSGAIALPMGEQTFALAHVFP